jgi:hypothetical protein
MTDAFLFTAQSLFAYCLFGIYGLAGTACVWGWMVWRKYRDRKRWIRRKNERLNPTLH